MTAPAPAAVPLRKEPLNYDDAGFFSFATFSWVNPLLAVGAKGTIHESDLPRLRETHKSEYLMARMRDCWQKELACSAGKSRREGMTLFKAMLRCYGPLQYLNQSLILIDSIVHVLQAVALGWLISYFSNADSTPKQGWGYAAVIVVAGIAFSFAHHHFFMQAWILGMQLRLGATCLIYDKLLRLRLASLTKVTTGHVINLCTGDVERFQLAGIFVNYLWEAPLETLVILIFGYREVGVSFLAGFLALALLVPAQAVCSRFFAKKRGQVAALADERIKLTSQAIGGARLVKISGWEPAMTREIRDIRGREINKLNKATQLRAFNEAIFFAQPAILTLLVFCTYHALGNTLTPPKVFTTLALLNITQFSMGKFFYMAVQSASEGWVAIRRIERFLLLRENIAEGSGKLPPVSEKDSAANASAISAVLEQKAPTADVIVPAGEEVPLGGAAGGRTAAATVLPQDVTVTASPSGEEEALVDPLGPAPAATLALVGRRSSGGAAVAGSGGGSTSRIVLRNASFHWEDDEPAGGGGGGGGGSGGGGSGGGEAGDVSATGRSGRGLRRNASASGSQPQRPQLQNGASVSGSGLMRSMSLRRKASASARSKEGGDASSVLGNGSMEPAKEPPREPALTLASIDLEVGDGELVGVVGPVGAAKSSLLMAVLQEMSAAVAASAASAAPPPAVSAGETASNGGSNGFATHGNGPATTSNGTATASNGPASGGAAAAAPGVLVAGRVAYASQEPWIQSGTLRSNVLFGRPYDAQRYERVIRACALESDLGQLPNGDLTVIGDRGVNLSGGQKARVGLARLCYSEADIYILDDPLSAVDPAVGRRLFSEAICGLLAGRTRLLVTHQVQYLMEPQVDRVLVMRKGRIAAAGRYADLVADGQLAGVGEGVPAGVSDVTGGGPLRDAAADAAAAAESGPNGVMGLHGTVPAIDEEGDEAEEDAELDTWYNGTNGTNGSGNHNYGNNKKSWRREERLPSAASAAEAAAGGRLSGLEPSLDDAVGVDIEGLRRPSSVSRGRSSSDGAGLVAGAGISGSSHRSRGRSCSGRSAERGEGAMGDAMEGLGGRKGAAAELVGAEEREKGEVGWNTYIQYAQLAAGVVLSTLLLGLLALGQALAICVTVWLGRWSAQTAQEQDSSRWIRGFVLLVAATLAVSVARASAAFWALLHASHVIHDKMLVRVLRAPILFFDSNPAGRILNRFSKDIGYLDDMLPATLYDYVTCGFMVLGSVLLICVVNPWVFLSLIPTLWYFRSLLRHYMRSSREIKRLDAVTRSPVYGSISETLDGLVTIRAYGQQQRFLKEFHEKLDENTKAYFAYIFTSRWLGFRLDFMVLVLLAAAAFVSVALKEYGSNSINPGMLGAGLIYVLQLGGLFQWAVRQAAEVENQMVSVERTLAYTRVEQEAALESPPEKRPPIDWPTKGHIEVRNLWATYRVGLAPVLRGLSYDIPGGARVGVVGRTGAGKSSFVAALFRLLEYDASRGSIELDGIRTNEVGLHELRPRMSAIPQTPFLFSGSVRLNMDPFARFDDAAIWAALEAVQMRTYIAGLPGGIEAPIAESGANLSVGQRQLLCLARAILQRTKVLVMDEATANIDLQTDALIQEAVRTQFSECTVIMIAHRLATIIDADKLIVLSHGTVAEQGHPHELLSKEGGAFASMVAETGEQTDRELRRMAKEAFYRHHPKDGSADTSASGSGSGGGSGGAVTEDMAGNRDLAADPAVMAAVVADDEEEKQGAE